jgi:Na+/proline symporter
MNLTLLDWTIIALYFLFNLGIGLYYARRARGSTSEFFLSGRDVPWWLAGTSMVATTFAADTPLLVTGLVVKNGIAGNWLWWNMVMSGMMTVFFYARLWRRAGVMTDIEFAELRYSGRPAAFLRGFRALYLGIPVNCIILGWVNLAMIKILRETLQFDQLATGTAWAAFLQDNFAVDAPVSLLILIGMLMFTAYYTTISGLWGVLVTDLFQFVLKMGMVILLAILAVNAVGGIDQLKSKVAARDAQAHQRAMDELQMQIEQQRQQGNLAKVDELQQLAANSESGSRLDFFPPLNSPWMPWITLCVYLAMNWWATWYPGAEPGGGGYVAQRIFSAKNERHGVLATLWFNVAHYALRPWPWILTALATIVLYPDLADKEAGYVKALMDPAVFPVWLRGFMIAAFAAAYMSTIGTQLNWGASYVINDFYRRFLVRNAGERHYVIASQIATLLLMVVSLVITFYLSSIEYAWKLLMATGAGTGTVLLLRWFWWRINAWSEIAAMIAAAAVSLFLQSDLATSASRYVQSKLSAETLQFLPPEYWPAWNSDDPRQFAYLMLTTVAITTVAWLVTTIITPPEPRATLIAFYRRVRPAGPGWKAIAAEAGGGSTIPTESLGTQFYNWVLGCVLIYASLFGIGKLVFKEWWAALACLAAAVVASVLISRNLSQANWSDENASA